MTEIRIEKTLAAALLPLRHLDMSKSGRGRLLIFAGTEGMMGAAVLCTGASLRSGAGLVTLCCPREQFPIPQTAVPEAMCVAREVSLFTPEYLGRFDAIAFGPGCPGEDPAYLLQILLHYKGILVLDAGGLDMLKKLYDDGHAARIRNERKCTLVMTPHCAEAARLLGRTYDEVAADRGKAAAEIVGMYGAGDCAEIPETIVLVKGHETKIFTGGLGSACHSATGVSCGENITSPEGYACDSAKGNRGFSGATHPQQWDPAHFETHSDDSGDSVGVASRFGNPAVFSNTTGNSGMATGGSGDVLTGVIAGLAAQYAAQQHYFTDADPAENGSDGVAPGSVLPPIQKQTLAPSPSRKSFSRTGSVSGPAMAQSPFQKNFACSVSGPDSEREACSRSFLSPAAAAAVLGVYLHGLAGDLAAEKITVYAMTAGDIIRSIPDAFQWLSGDGSR